MAARPDVPHPTPGKGKHQPAKDGKKAGKGLNKKLGPLPVWGWGVGLVLAIAVGVYLRKRSGATQSSGDTATPTQDQGSGSGGGAAPLPPMPVDTAPPPLPPDLMGALPADNWPWTDAPITDVPADTGTFAPVWGTDTPLALIYQGDPINQPNLAPLPPMTSSEKRAAIMAAASNQPNAATAAGFLGAFGVRSIGRIPIVTIRPPAPSREGPHLTALHSRQVRSAISLGEHSRRDRESPGRSRHTQPVRHTQAHPSAGYSGYATGHTYSAPHHASPPAKSRTGGAGRTYAI